MRGVKVRFEILEHPADVGFLAYGATLAELFENAALAMCSLVCAPEKIENRQRREIAAGGLDIEALLYAWLAEILAVADAEQLVLCSVKVADLREPSGKIAGEVRGTVQGEKFSRERHDAGTYIKAVTLHQFAVGQVPEGYRARVFLDL
jgi:SHS2 domain-containing protein